MKDLTIAKKSIFEKVKEMLKNQKQKYIESQTNTARFKAFLEANKDSEFFKRMNQVVHIDLREEDAYLKTLKFGEYNYEGIPKFNNDCNESLGSDKKEISSIEQLKEIYKNVKDNKIDINELAEADLFKIYLMLQEEEKLKRQTLNIEKKDNEQLEIENLINEIQTLEKEIKRLEDESNNN